MMRKRRDHPITSTSDVPIGEQTDRHEGAVRRQNE